MADQAQGGDEQRVAAGHPGVALDLPVGDGGADADVVVADGQILEVGGAGDVDQHLGAGQPQRHHRDQALAAGEDAGLLPVLGEEVDRVCRRLGEAVEEGGRLHGAAT